MQHRQVRTAAAHRRSTTDLPTILLAAVIYGGWIALTLHAAQMPAPLVAVIGGWLLAWQGSLQHETIHGHPTPSARLNTWLGFAPLCLWLPYGRYRDLHLAHHATDDLTHPGADPESRYLRPDSHAVKRLLGRLSSTLLGRLVLGPPIEISSFLITEARAVVRGDPGVRRAWALHVAGVVVVLGWLHWACGLGLGFYLLAFVYPGAALSLLRSFAEHRADADPERRIAIVERAPLLGLLFLNNNLHAVHHAFPGAPWRRLPALYAQHRAAILKANGGLVYAGYADVARRYLLRPHDVLVHPAGPAAPELERLLAA